MAYSRERQLYRFVQAFGLAGMTTFSADVAVLTKNLSALASVSGLNSFACSRRVIGNIPGLSIWRSPLSFSCNTGMGFCSPEGLKSSLVAGPSLLIVGSEYCSLGSQFAQSPTSGITAVGSFQSLNSVIFRHTVSQVIHYRRILVYITLLASLAS